MIKVYTGLKGSVVVLFLIAGVVLFISIFCLGIAKAIQFLLPLLIVLSYALIFVFLVGILPATLFKNLRPYLCVYSLLISQALGALTWMVSFFLVVNIFGFGGIFLVFLFQFLAPIALAGEVLKGSWVFAAHLSLWIIFTYAIRFYSQWLLKSNPPPHQKKGDIIDVEAVEVRELK